MSYTKTKAIEFWYEFDQATNPGFGGVSQETIDLYLGVYGQSFDLDGLVDDVRDATLSGDLQAVVQGREDSFVGLANFQIAKMDKHFTKTDDLRKAFEDFGHGVLHDNKRLPNQPSRYRRPQGFMNHMMDGSPDDCVGYHRWHAFIRAAVVAGANRDRWLHVNRCVGLAWAIYSELNPEADSPSNPKLDAQKTRRLRNLWMNAGESTLNAAFLSYSGSFPSGYGNRRARSVDEIKFSHVQNILSQAAGSRTPRHGGLGRFWEKPLNEFVRQNVYGNPLVAASGADRGQRSALVQVLKGELAGFGRMPPFPMQPVPPSDIEYIEAWIDNLEIA